MSKDLKKLFEDVETGKLDAQKEIEKQDTRHAENEAALKTFLPLCNRLQEVKDVFGKRGYQAQLYKSFNELPGLGLSAGGANADNSPALIVHPSPENMAKREIAWRKFLDMGGYGSGGPKKHEQRLLDYKWSLNSFSLKTDACLHLDIETGEFYNSYTGGSDRNPTVEYHIKTNDVDLAAAWLVEETAKLPEMPHPYISVSYTDPTDTTGNPSQDLPTIKSKSNLVNWIAITPFVIIALILLMFH